MNRQERLLRNLAKEAHLEVPLAKTNRSRSEQIRLLIQYKQLAHQIDYGWAMDALERRKDIKQQLDILGGVQ